MTGSRMDLVALHLLEDLVDVGARVDPAGRPLREVTRGDLGGVVAHRHAADHDVAVREDPAEAFVLVADGQRAHVQLSHELGGAVQGLVSGDPLRTAVHDVSGGGHGVPPGAGGKRSTVAPQVPAQFILPALPWARTWERARTDT